MNPFSGFLQPQNNRPLQGVATTQDILRTVQGNKELTQRQLENTQQNDRANKRLGMEQAYQDRKFSQEDQKQVEALLAEYQEAEDQGDPVRLSRAAQMLQRFGMDVGQGGQKPDLAAFTGQQKPDLRALTGERALPNVTARPSPADLQALTGQPQNPIDQAVAQEMKSREALQAKNVAPEENLSQEDFESQLIKGAGQLPERMEQGGQTTAAMKAILPKAPEDEPVNLGDVDSPEFKQAAAQEGTNGSVIDLDKEDPTPLQVGGPQAAPQAQPPPRRLSTQLLPTVVSKGGKQLYESTGPSGRWAPMVSGVFDQFTQHENPEIASAAKRAQVMASKLISVDGIAPKEAIKIGMDYLNGEANRIINLERTKLGSRNRGGGGAGGGAVGDMPLTGKELALLGDDAQQLMLSITAKPEYQKVSVMDDVLNGAESALSSNDPVRQQQAISDIMRARSGLTVRKDEEASLQNAAGLWEGIKTKLSQKAGYGLTEDYRRSLANAISAQRAINDRIRRRIAEETKQFYLKTRTTSDGDSGSRARQVRRNADAVGGMLGRSAASPDEVGEEDLY